MSNILNSWILTFWVCVLLHLIADFNLQGILADMKQVVWWWKHAPDKKYEHDWRAALLCHAFMWSIITFAPLAFITNPYAFSVIVILNALIHACVDVMKANLRWINLVEDQLAHLAQIIITIYCCSILVSIN